MRRILLSLALLLGLGCAYNGIGDIPDGFVGPVALFEMSDHCKAARKADRPVTCYVETLSGMDVLWIEYQNSDYANHPRLREWADYWLIHGGKVFTRNKWTGEEGECRFDEMFVLLCGEWVEGTPI